MSEKPVQLYYVYDPQECGDKEILISGKEYTDYHDEFNEQPNGEDGVLDPEYEGPYNWLYEVHEIMSSLDCFENTEAVFDISDYPLEEILKIFTDKGYEMIEYHEPDEDDCDEDDDYDEDEYDE